MSSERIREMTAELRLICERYEDAARMFRDNAACSLGCSFCCTFMGNIDIVTLEGIIIRNHMEGFSEEEKMKLAEMILRDSGNKQEGKESPCPFLSEAGSCRIYPVRPFSCRQLYSLRKCDNGGPLVHRQAYELSRETVRQIQALDESGYAGHISNILLVCELPGFNEAWGKDDLANMIDGAGKLFHHLSANRRCRRSG